MKKRKLIVKRLPKQICKDPIEEIGKMDNGTQMEKDKIKMTVREFMLKKFPTNKYMDCPVPKHHWETIQEYAEEYHKWMLRNQNKNA